MDAFITASYSIHVRKYVLVYESTPINRRLYVRWWKVLGLTKTNIEKLMRPNFMQVWEAENFSAQFFFSNIVSFYTKLHLIKRSESLPPKNEDHDLLYMCFRVANIFTLHWPQDVGTVMFDCVAETIAVLTGYLSASFHMCGKFNVHYRDYLVDSNKADDEGRYCRDFTVAFELTHIIDKRTRRRNLLTSSSQHEMKKYFAEVLHVFRGLPIIPYRCQIWWQNKVILWCAVP